MSYHFLKQTFVIALRVRHVFDVVKIYFTDFYATERPLKI